MLLRGWGVRVGAVAAVAGVPLLAGCSEEATPVVTPTPVVQETAVESPDPGPTLSPELTPAAEPSTEPAPTELTEEEILAAIPERADFDDFLGAQEFARFFLENYQAMMRESPEKFELFTEPDCGFCANVEQLYQDVQSEGRIYEGGDISVLESDAQGGLQKDGTWVVIFSIDAEEMIERDSDGSIAATYEGGPGKAAVSLTFNEHWRVLELSAEES